ncbi:hypothetical protein [Azonexus sp.]|uniref:hypothetical protein n=1 Tax=Azonexus sp. TaxID=1872668 RepID=UPI0035AF87FA
MAGTTIGEAAALSAAGTGLLQIEDCEIDEHCVGHRWQVRNLDELARCIAIIAMGQALQAAHLISLLEQMQPAFTTEELKAEAIRTLTVQEDKQEPRVGYPQVQRDGFIFEAISWIAAKQTYGGTAYLKDPHVSSTSQGLDGLMLELTADKSDITRVTVFEDKCTKKPKETFAYKVMPGFQDRHKNRRSAEIISTASVLLKTAGLADGDAIKLASAVLKLQKRRYRAALTVTAEFDNSEARSDLFSKFKELDGISKDQRHGACFVVPSELRSWFNDLAEVAIAYLNDLDPEMLNV